MARMRLPSRLHLLSVRELQTASDGDHSDGGGLMLRVRDASASWVFRYTAGSGRRREMGLGAADRNNSAIAGASLHLTQSPNTQHPRPSLAGCAPLDRSAPPALFLTEWINRLVNEHDASDL